MRIIKFRAWDEENKVMRYSDTMHLAEFFNYCDGWIIMQYTGLKEIYERDIITKTRNWKFTWVIEWHRYRLLARNIQNRNVCQELYQLAKWKNLEVLGNIHENPELKESP
jgi:hypothetical protein